MDINWYGENESSLWYIMKTLVEFIMKLDEYNIYHSDIKNQNIVVVVDW